MKREFVAFCVFLAGAAAAVHAAAEAKVLFQSKDGCTPYGIVAEDWKEGLSEWPSVTIPVPEEMRDFRGYDRLVAEFVNEGGDPRARLNSYVSGPSGHINRGLAAGGCAVLAYSFKRLDLSLKGWEHAPGVDPANVTRVHFFMTRPQAVKLRFHRLVLLPKGVACPPTDEVLMEKVVRPLETRRAKMLAEDERIRRAKRNVETAAFRRACADAGQTGDFCLGAGTSMDKVRPREGMLPAVARSVQVRLAQGEKESTQIFVMPAERDLKNVRVRISSLLLDGMPKTEFPASGIKVSVLGYVNVVNPAPYPRGENKPVAEAPGYLREAVPCRTGWWPDPILDFLDSADVACGDVQGFWIRIHAPAWQKSGIYRGTATVSADGAKSVSLPFSVRVYGFGVPVTPMLPLAVTFAPGPTTQHEGAEGLALAAARKNDPLSPVNQWRKQRGAWADFLADHYLSWDHLYHSKSPDFEMLERQRAKGLEGMFNLGYWDIPGEGEEGKATWKSRTLARLRDAYARAKELGIAHRAYVYGCDEASKTTFERIKWAAGELRRELPGVPISTTAYDNNYGVDSPLSPIDWFTPQTVVFDREKAEASRRAGHQVWWYFACDQKAPCANSFVEAQGIEMRSVMGAQAVKFRPDGFLYYQTTIWNSLRPIASGPFTDWDPRSWTTFHGDGSWTCCGPDGAPLSTVRLENFSDGLEDYAYAMILEKKLAARGTREDGWAQKARKLLAVPRKVVDTVKNYSDDPAVIYRWRDAMAELIETADR